MTVPVIDSELTVEKITEFQLTMEATKKHIVERYLQPFRQPGWVQVGQVSLPFGRLGTALHTHFFERFRLVEGIFPTNHLLSLVICSSLVFEAVFPLFLSPFLLASIRQIAISRLFPLIASVVILASIAFLYSAVGSYWTLFELLFKSGLSIRMRAYLVATSLTGILGWFLVGSPMTSDPSRIESSIQSGDNWALLNYQEMVWITPEYRLFAILLVYIPALCHLSVWIVRIAATLVFFIRNAFSWFLNVNNTNEVDRLKQFLFEEIMLDNGQTYRFVSLDRPAIDAVKRWSLLRRQIVQSRLVPLSIVFGFLGVFFSTSIGDSLLSELILTLQDYLLSSGGASTPIGSTISYLQILGALVAIGIPVVLLLGLLNEAFAMDFLTEACELAEIIKPEVSDERRDTITPLCRGAGTLRHYISRALGISSVKRT